MKLAFYLTADTVMEAIRAQGEKRRSGYGGKGMVPELRRRRRRVAQPAWPITRAGPVWTRPPADEGTRFAAKEMTPHWL